MITQLQVHLPCQAVPSEPQRAGRATPLKNVTKYLTEEGSVHNRDLNQVQTCSSLGVMWAPI